MIEKTMAGAGTDDSLLIIRSVLLPLFSPPRTSSSSRSLHSSSHPLTLLAVSFEPIGIRRGSVRSRRRTRPSTARPSVAP